MATKVKSVEAPKQTQVQVGEPVTLIRQAELKAYRVLENKIDELTEQLETKSAELKNLLGAGVPVEKGVFSAEIKTEERRTPSWKTEAINLADQLNGAGQGQAWADEVLARTEPKTIVKLTVK